MNDKSRVARIADAIPAHIAATALLTFSWAFALGAVSVPQGSMAAQPSVVIRGCEQCDPPPIEGEPMPLPVPEYKGEPMPFPAPTKQPVPLKSDPLIVYIG